MERLLKEIEETKDERDEARQMVSDHQQQMEQAKLLLQA